MISYIYIYTICWQSHMRVVGVAHHQHDDYLCLYMCVSVLLYNMFFFGYIYIPSVPRHLKIVIYIYIFKIQKKNIDVGGGSN